MEYEDEYYEEDEEDESMEDNYARILFEKKYQFCSEIEKTKIKRMIRYLWGSEKKSYTNY